MSVEVELGTSSSLCPILPLTVPQRCLKGLNRGLRIRSSSLMPVGRVYVSYMATTFLGPLSTLTNPHLSRPDLKLPAERALGFQANNGIFVTQSPDGGLTWGPSAAVTSNLYDGKTQVPFDIMPDLAIDTFRTLPNGASNPNFGRMYVVFSRYYPSGQFPGQPAASGGSRILLGISDDQGQSWSLARDAKDQVGLPAVPIPIGFGLGQAPPGLGSVNWTHITVGPEGDLYVSMFNFDAFEVYHSKDGGRSYLCGGGHEGSRRHRRDSRSGGHHLLPFQRLWSHLANSDPDRFKECYGFER